MKNRPQYQTPTVRTMSAAQIVELMGPVQGYSGGSSPRFSPTSGTSGGGFTGLREDTTS